MSVLIGVEVFERIAGKQTLHGFREMLFQSDIDGAHRAMEVNRAKQVRSGFNKIDQCRQTTRMNRQACAT